MTAWFEDLPLDWTRDETRSFEKLIIVGYQTKDTVFMLAENVGLDLADIDESGSLKKVVRDILGNARSSERLLTLIAEILLDRGKKAIHPQLSALVAGHEAAVREAGINREPSLETLALLPPTFDVWAANDAEPVRGSSKSGLEKVLNLAAGFVDPGKLLINIAAAQVRVARVDVGGKATGTGFLVGSNLLMTNWHVVENLQQRGVDGVVARFDYSVASDGRAVQFADDWLVAHSQHDTVTNEMSTDGPAEGTWDFAIVRLAEPVGAQPMGGDLADAGAERRGYYALDWAAYDFDAEETLSIFGHPKRDLPAQLSIGSPAKARFTSTRSRVRYNTNSDEGSSGSPVFNKDFRVVALHNSGSKGADDAKNFNQGVPIARIGDDLRTQLAGKPELALLGLT